MSSLEDVHCLALEEGAVFNFKTRKFQPLGQPVIQARIEYADCSRRRECPFYQKYHRCPTREELDSKRRLVT